MAEDRSVFELVAPAAEKTVQYGPTTDEVIDLFGLDQDTGRMIVLIHGGFWSPEFDRLHLRPLAAAIALKGHRVALVEYPRIPGNPDTTVNGVIAALNHISQMSSDVEMVVIGHSAGGHLALCAAAQMKFHKVIALAPVSNLLDAEQRDLGEGAVRKFLGSAASSRPDLDPFLLGLNANRVTVFHGIEDQRVPVEQSRNYAEEKHGGANLVELECLGHFELIDPTHEFFGTLMSEIVAD